MELVRSIRHLTIGQGDMEGMRPVPPKPLRPSRPSGEEEHPSFRVYRDFHPPLRRSGVAQPSRHEDPSGARVSKHQC
jgi:hypothetical protein